MPAKAKSKRLPALPPLLNRKIYKTGQTRGADDDVIFQNRVSRSSTVLIPYRLFDTCGSPPHGDSSFQNGLIVLIEPSDYFDNPNIQQDLQSRGLSLGGNALVFYETRADWNRFPPDHQRWTPASSRSNPLGGEYVARVPATTAAEGGGKINRGFTDKDGKGAGIRLYEYASSATINACCLQLEALYWLCSDSMEVATSGSLMAKMDAEIRKDAILEQCKSAGLLDLRELEKDRIVNGAGHPVCPFCMEELSGVGFISRLAQAEGREVPDLTVTQINLFHVQELKYGLYNHRPYNLGWGHHHCNVVVKDSGVIGTLDWMVEVLERNIKGGHYSPKTSSL